MAGIDYLKSIQVPNLAEAGSMEQKVEQLAAYANKLHEALRYILTNLGSGNFNGQALTEIQDQTLSRLVFQVGTDETGSITLKMMNGKTQLASENIDLSGVVTFNDLENEGQTKINGANIVSGRISGITLESMAKDQTGAFRQGVVIENGSVYLTYDGEAYGHLTIGDALGTIRLEASKGFGLYFLADEEVVVEGRAGVRILGGPVTIGEEGQDVKLVGNVSVNGTALSATRKEEA